ncbi:hypothetical protein BDV39DRAFT_215217 [Aspergillus sergii]|uniref:Aminoglycoside phosphotransferase domain-containing protein n=1 Tax=Aspergillus sergii TaxID=1034303 RepID=A0A5N6X2A7_9EURO|nr:hypothetical protein BDV39DRAFT_215217 [Aspergillus sergii]
MGCANYHARSRFSDDGSVWLLRVPRITSSIPQSLSEYLIRSEYVTLKFLETTNVPAPRVFDYDLASNENNKVGVSYNLMEQMGGRPWNKQGPHGERFADDKDKERVWNGLADILIEIQRHPFSKAGSLLPGPVPSEPIVSAVAGDRFLVLSPSGPFGTASDYYSSFVEQKMVLIADALAVDLNHDSLAATEQFYIKHVDDKGDHLVVDDELNITGIIDWQMARVVPASEAFGPSLVTAEMGDIYNGESSLTIHDHALICFLKVKESADLADIMSRDERLRRFFFGHWAAFGVDKDTDWKAWKVDMLEQYIHNGRLKHFTDRLGEGP